MITPPAKRFTTVNGHRLARVIAPDLIGHGDSDKLPASLGPGGLTLEGAYELLAGQLASLVGEERVTLVRHDWGSALGFHWARRRRATKPTAPRPASIMLSVPASGTGVEMEMLSRLPP